MALPAGQLGDRDRRAAVAQPAPVVRTAEFGATRGSSSGCHVLLVEDDASIAELYATVLRANGHTVTHALDGLAGLDAIRAGRFDLILLDIRMPRMDGLAMLRAVSAEQVATSTPVVVLTNYDDMILQQQAVDLGVKDYLLKSRVLPQEIASKVSKWCQ
jgi:CheY-like chemotaxis protein